MIWLAQPPQTAVQWDMLICTELPNPERSPVFTTIARTHATIDERVPHLTQAMVN
jgi:Zn-dependent protease with chaperone function